MQDAAVHTIMAIVVLPSYLDGTNNSLSLRILHVFESHISVMVPLSFLQRARERE